MSSSFSLPNLSRNVNSTANLLSVNQNKLMKDCKLNREVDDCLSMAVKNDPLWLPDNLCYHCIGCEAKFTFFLRRHHCRHCGLIFCYRCSSMVIHEKRTCAFCFVRYKGHEAKEYEYEYEGRHESKYHSRGTNSYDSITFETRENSPQVNAQKVEDWSTRPHLPSHAMRYDRESAESISSDRPTIASFKYEISEISIHDISHSIDCSSYNPSNLS